MLIYPEIFIEIDLVGLELYNLFKMYTYIYIILGDYHEALFI